MVALYSLSTTSDLSADPAHLISLANTSADTPHSAASSQKSNRLYSARSSATSWNAWHTFYARTIVGFDRITAFGLTRMQAALSCQRRCWKIDKVISLGNRFHGKKACGSWMSWIERCSVVSEWTCSRGFHSVSLSYFRNIRQGFGRIKESLMDVSRYKLLWHRMHSRHTLSYLGLYRLLSGICPSLTLIDISSHRLHAIHKVRHSA